MPSLKAVSSKRSAAAGHASSKLIGSRLSRANAIAKAFEWLTCGFERRSFHICNIEGAIPSRIRDSAWRKWCAQDLQWRIEPVMHKRRRWKDQLSHWRRLLYAAPFEPLRDLEIDTPAWRFLVEARSAVDALLRASVELEFDKEQLAAEIRRLRGDVCRLQDDNIRFASSLQSIARSGSVAECRELSRRALENDISTSGQISVVNDSRVARQRG